jgi:hypothetical protein
VQNVSVSGTDTSDSLARFDSDVTPYKPRFVMLATSIVNEPEATAVQSYLQNTLLLIRKVESIGAIPILVAPYPNNGFSAAMYSSIKDLYATLASQGVPILDFLDGTDDGQGHWLPGLDVDGTHPNDIGHGLLFDCIPLTLFDALQLPMPPVNPHGFGSWVQSTGLLTEGDIEIRPSSGMGSWTISFWTGPSAATAERVLLSVNTGQFQVRRAGASWGLWSGGAILNTMEVRPVAPFHHIAMTYQSFAGILELYIDAQLRSRAIVPGANPVTVLSIGGDPGTSGWNAEDDRFADVVLYRAPLSQTDIQAIRIGQGQWKSVEAWLPLTYSPSRPTLNLAASVPAVIVHGVWNWSGEGIQPISPFDQRWLAQGAVPPRNRVALDAF